MLFKLIVVISVAISVRGGLIPQTYQENVVLAEPHNPNPQYSYLYEVQDPITGKVTSN